MRSRSGVSSSQGASVAAAGEQEEAVPVGGGAGWRGGLGGKDMDRTL